MRKDRPPIEGREEIAESSPLARAWRQPTAEESANFYRGKVALEHAISQPRLSERLRSAVREAASRDADSMEALRAEVSSFTVAFRDAGTTPEHALAFLKTIVNNRSLLTIAPHVSDWRGDRLREQISTWFIEEYFREKTV